jgi:hypothetical protein
MTRMVGRAMWLSAGVALGAGGTIWVRRRLEVLSDKLRSGQATADVVSMAGRGARAAASQVRLAVDAGRDSARRRSEELWEELDTSAKAR